MKIAFFDGSIEWNGGSNRVLSLSKKLQEMGHSVIIVANPKSDLANLAQSQRVSVWLIRSRNQWDPTSYWNIYNFLKRENPHIIEINSAHFQFSVSLINKFLKRKGLILVKNLHEVPSNRLTRKIEAFIYKRFVDKIITVSKAVKEMLVEAYGLRHNEPEVVYDGINVDVLNPLMEGGTLRKELQIKNDEILIGTLGRLIPQKNFHIFLEAARLIHKEFPRTRFVIIGKGPLKNDLLRMAEEMNLSDCFYLVDFRFDAFKNIKEMDIVVMPSSMEALSRILIEACALAKPVIATCVGGNPEAVIHGKTGFLVPPNDARAIKEAILPLLRSEKERLKMGQAGRCLAMERFNLDLIAKKCEKIYEEVLSMIT